MHPLIHPLFTQFITYFNKHEDYFECHEVLEEYWKEIAPRDKTHPLTSWILLSTGMYHWRRGNFKGAYRSLKSAHNRIQLNDGSTFYEGLHMSNILDNLQQSIEFVHQQKPFHPFTIPVHSEELKEAIRNQHIPDPLTGDALIHKHMLRDRSEILKAREEKRRNRH